MSRAITMMMQHENVDNSEISKFERLAHSWWDINGEAKPLHQMNPLRANFIDERSPVAAQRLLDVGCGGGLLSEAMAQRGAHVTGIDMGEGAIKVAQLHAQESQLEIQYRCKSAEALAEELITDEAMTQASAERFDIITCLEMLEHVPNPGSVIQACAKLLKPGGSAYFSTINRTPKAYAIAVLGAEYLLKVLPKGTHDYTKFIKPSELAQSCRHAGLTLSDIRGFVYNPLTQKFKLHPNAVNANYIVHVTKDVE